MLRASRRNSHSATPPRTVKIATKPPSVVQTCVELTFGELAWEVFKSPCTIHGCRPDSVISQPPVFIRNGSTPAAMHAPSQCRELARRPRLQSHRPLAASASTSPHRKIIERNDQ